MMAEKKFLLEIRLAEHDAMVNPAFIASAKMAVNYYVKCAEAESEHASLESYLKNPPDTKVDLTMWCEYRARHILVKSEDEARKIIEKLDQGADFSALAKEKSTDTSGPEGGELGWFSTAQ